MKYIIVVIVVVAFGVYSYWAKLIGFTYPNVIENQPFVNSLKITKIEGDVTTLSNGCRIKTIQRYDNNKKSHVQVGDSVYLDHIGDEEYMVKALVDGWVCGTPWARCVTVPLIKQDVYKNRIEVVLLGKKVDG